MSISRPRRCTLLTDVIASTIASTTAGRRPSLKFGTHSTIRFICAPHQFATFEGGRTKVYRGEIRNLTVIRYIVHGDIGLLARLDRTEAILSEDRARGING